MQQRRQSVMHAVLDAPSNLLSGALNLGKHADFSSGKSLGVLLTGYMDKRNPVSGRYQRRFMVLTQQAVHWFKRDEEYDLFGEERGKVGQGAILAVRVLESDSSMFELQSTDNVKRRFKTESCASAEAWVTAIRSISKFAPAGKERKENKEEAKDGNEVEILLVSLFSQVTNAEIVIARNPSWNRVILIRNVTDGDKVIVSTSNGGTVTLTSEDMKYRAETGDSFDATIHEAPLPSSLNLSFGVHDNSGVAKKDEEPALPVQGNNNSWRIVALTSNPRFAVNLLLALMVVLIGLSSAPFLTEYHSLMFIVSAVLAGSNIIQAIVRFPPSKSTAIKSSYVFILKSHAYTSPDAAITAAIEDEIPQRFINGCDGDLKEARRRWDVTRHWRESEGVNAILDTPQPHYATIKRYFPHYQCGRGKLGHVVYYERPGEIDQVQLKARGIGLDEIGRHWLFVTEYQWKYLAPDPMAKSIAVLDIGAVTMGVLAGEALDSVKKTVNWANQHYPERSYVILVVNAPMWFSWIWKLIKGLVHENTQRKIKILSQKEVLNGLLEHIDIDQIPSYYGGGMDFGGKDSCRFHSPDSLALAEYVKKLNNRHTNKQQPFDDDDDGDNVAPPGQPGEAAPITLSTTNVPFGDGRVTSSVPSRKERPRSMRPPPYQPPEPHVHSDINTIYDADACSQPRTQDDDDDSWDSSSQQGRYRHNLDSDAYSVNSGMSDITLGSNIPPAAPAHSSFFHWGKPKQAYSTHQPNGIADVNHQHHE